jgi:hypothetical protein
MAKRRDDFLIGPKEKAIEAIQAGKKEEAIKYLNEVSEQFHRLHDSYGNDINKGFGYLAQAYGEEWLKDYVGKDILEGFTIRFTPWQNFTAEQKVAGVCSIHRAHYSEFHYVIYK